MKTICRFVLIAIAGTLAACGGSDDEHVTKRPGEPDVVHVKTGDAKMEAAIAKSRETVETFIAALKSPKAGQEGFSVKKAFPTSGGDQEHIWLSDVSYDGKMFKGRVGNDPVDVKKLKLGDPASVAPAEISDWMYVQGNRLVGGYTIRVLYDFNSPAGRKKFEAETGLKAD